MELAWRRLAGGLVVTYSAAEAAAIVALWRVAAVQALAMRQAGSAVVWRIFWAMCRDWARYWDFLPWRSAMFIHTPGLVVLWAMGWALSGVSLWRLVRRWMPPVSDAAKPRGRRVSGPGGRGASDSRRFEKRLSDGEGGVRGCKAGGARVLGV